MSTSDTLNILFVINPKAGAKAKLNWETIVRNYFKDLSHHIEFYLLTGKNDAASIQYWIDKIKPDRIIAVGGDGTVSSVAKILLGSGIPMGILPAGSANGMARELEIPDTVESAMDVLLNGIVKKSDVIKINEDNICIHLSDLGINAQIIKYFQQVGKRGKWGYAKVLFKALWRRKRMHVTIELDDKNHETDAFMVVLANASKYGTGAVINPEGNLHDGKFEVVVVRKLAFSEFLKLFINFRRFNPKKVEIFQTRSVHIETTRKIHFQIDGEFIGRVTKVNAQIVPAQLDLLLPVKH